MIGKLKENILCFFDLLALRRRRRKMASRESMMSVPLLRGNMKSVIVVKAPTPIFTQAVFILRDDYFSDASVSREALMTQARSAADIYCGSFRRPRDGKKPFALAGMSAATASALTILAMKLFGSL